MQSLFSPTLFKPYVTEDPSHESTIHNQKNARICQIAKWCFALLGAGLALTHAFSHGDRRVFVAKHLATQLAVMAFSLASFCTALFFQILGSKHNSNLTEEKIANARVKLIFNEIEEITTSSIDEGKIQSLIETLNTRENLVEKVESDIEGYKEIKLLFSVKHAPLGKIFDLIKLALRNKIFIRFNESIEIDQKFDFTKDLELFVDLQVQLLEHIHQSIDKKQSKILEDDQTRIWNKVVNNIIPASIYQITMDSSGRVTQPEISEVVEEEILDKLEDFILCDEYLSDQGLNTGRVKYLCEEIENITEQHHLVETVACNVEGYTQIKLGFSVKYVSKFHVLSLIEKCLQKKIIVCFDESIDIQNLDFNRDLRRFVNLQIELMRETKFNYMTDRINRNDLMARGKIISSLIPQSIYCIEYDEPSHRPLITINNNLQNQNQILNKINNKLKHHVTYG
ncbi:MAG: hypothetical protein Tsb0021_08050 [Chlamydiales bacterium]